MLSLVVALHGRLHVVRRAVYVGELRRNLVEGLLVNYVRSKEHQQYLLRVLLGRHFVVGSEFRGFLRRSSSKVSFDPSLFLPLLRECVPSLDPVALVSIIYHWVRLVAEEGTFSYVLTLCSL